MGYTYALETAGAIVHQDWTFGSYQGEWMAHVTLPDGRTGVIMGYYGSCSGCDAFEAEFGYDMHRSERHPDDEHRFDCDQCLDYQRRLYEFGQEYFTGLMTIDEAAEAVLQRTWGDDPEVMRALLDVGPSPDVAARLREALEADY